jgi:hypothetical protein
VFDYNASNWHYAYRRVVRHWHTASEAYAGGDCLLTALNNGWDISERVVAHEHWRAGTRCVMVYHFELTLNGETMIMPVITNPFVERLIAENALRVLLERKVVYTR